MFGGVALGKAPVTFSPAGEMAALRGDAATNVTRYNPLWVRRPPVVKYIAPSGPNSSPVTFSGRPFKKSSVRPA